MQGLAGAWPILREAFPKKAGWLDKGYGTKVHALYTLTWYLNPIVLFAVFLATRGRPVLQMDG